MMNELQFVVAAHRRPMKSVDDYARKTCYLSRRCKRFEKAYVDGYRCYHSIRQCAESCELLRAKT